MFFTAQEPVHGAELWKSDGTADGTMLVKDINPGPGSGLVSGGNSPKIYSGGLVYFMANDGSNGFQLWRSDGTAPGTFSLQAVDVVSNPTNLTDVNGTLYFVGTTALSGAELWKSDGTALGTVMVKDIVPGPDSSNPGRLTNWGGTLYFSALNQIWKSDGTGPGTVPVVTLGPTRLAGFEMAPSGPRHGLLFFFARTNPNGAQLWKSDGTQAGTGIVRDVNQSTDHSSPSELVNANGTLFFVATDPVHGRAIWKSDGTAAGTVLVRTLDDFFQPNIAVANGNLVYFTASDSAGGPWLWRTDGTAAGTFVLSHTLMVSLSPDPGAEGGIFINNIFYFAGTDNPRAGAELWRSDGTVAGTCLVKQINPTSGGSNPNQFTDVGGTLLFLARDKVGDEQLWRSDGTAGGTQMVTDFSPAPTYIQLFGSSQHGNDDGTLFFGVTLPGGSRELWHTDGTATGTSLVAPALIYNWTIVGNLLFYTTIAANAGELCGRTVPPPARSCCDAPVPRI